MIRQPVQYPINKGIPMKILPILILFVLFAPAAHAEVSDAIKQLQYRANSAYELMMQARREADNLQKDVAFAEKELQIAKQRLAEREKKAEEARQKSADAQRRLERANAQWKEASDILEREWQQSGRY